MSETRTLAAYVVDSPWSAIPADVRHEAKRALVNYMGCALGGAPHPAMDITWRALGPYAGAPTTAVLGRREKTDPLHASLLNGISSHVYDFDDTTPKNYGHPTSPVASAMFAYAALNPVNGADFLNAFVLGFEAESRVANAVYPAHYDVGWHMTGTAGVFGSATAIGRLLGLDLQQMIWAIGLAATQAAGLREMFGSMGKAFHPGRSAQNGYAAALLAREGFTAGIHGIEGPRGFAAVQAAHYDLAKITANLGTDYNLRDNTYKPFPCGIVNHPTIDGAIQLQHQRDFTPESITGVRLHVAPLVLDLCNKQHITVGLEGKFSVYHGAAVGLCRGKAGLQEYSDEAVNDPQIKRVRELATAVADTSLTDDQARIEVTLANGTTYSKFVEQSLGNIHKPLTDAQLDTKFLNQAVLGVPLEQAKRVLAMCWAIDTLTDVGDLTRAAALA